MSSRNRSPEAVARAFYAQQGGAVGMPACGVFQLAELIRAERAAFRRIVRATTKPWCQCGERVGGGTTTYCNACIRRDAILAALEAKPTKEPRNG